MSARASSISRSNPAESRELVCSPRNAAPSAMGAQKAVIRSPPWPSGPPNVCGRTRASASSPRFFEFYEQGNLYSSYNYSLAYRCDAQSTVSGIGLNLLWCPSDTEIAGVVYTEQPRWRHSFPWPVTFTSYAGNYGEWAGTITGDPASTPGDIAAVVTRACDFLAAPAGSVPVNKRSQPVLRPCASKLPSKSGISSSRSIARNRAGSTRRSCD